MGTIIGREREMHMLAECMQSPRSELIAVFGRWRSHALMPLRTATLLAHI